MSLYDNIAFDMLPDYTTVTGAPWPVLPPGVHQATLDEVERHFAYNGRRRRLFQGLRDAATNLAQAGCRALYLNGSFVTDKPIPEDFDACWDPQGVDRSKLDPVFSQFSNKRAAQKQKFGGEFFLSTTRADAQGRTFIDFFQIEKYTGESKGIVLINLSTDPVLQQQVTP